MKGRLARRATGQGNHKLSGKTNRLLTSCKQFSAIFAAIVAVCAAPRMTRKRTMNLAQLSPGSGRRTSSSTPYCGVRLADALKSLPSPRLQESDLQVCSLSSEQERAAHAAFVAALMRERAPLGSAAEGELLRRRVIRVLGQFRDQGTITLPPSKKTWERLHILARMCASAADWTSQTGPIVGASNAVLEVKLDSTNVRRDLRDMARCGLIVPFCPKGNGHRFYVPARKGKAAIGAGWSLAPLVLMIDHLEAVAATEAELREMRVALPAEIKSYLNTMRSLLAPFVDAHMWAQALAQKVEKLADRRRDTPRSSLPEMRKILEDTLALHDQLQHAVIVHSRAVPPEGELSTTPDENVHRKYNRNQTLRCKVGLAEGRNREATQDLEASSKTQAEQNKSGALQADDAFGIKRSGFTWDETASLFPFTEGFIALPSSPTIASAQALARAVGVADATVISAAQALGLEAAMLCVLLTGQHACDGEILRSPDIYMRALIERAGRGDLNLGNSLFGRRSKISEPARRRIG
jgi:replication initiation protein RepC